MIGSVMRYVQQDVRSGKNLTVSVGERHGQRLAQVTRVEVPCVLDIPSVDVTHALLELGERRGLCRIGRREGMRERQQMRAKDAVDGMEVPNDRGDEAAHEYPAEPPKPTRGARELRICPLLVAHE